MAAGLPAGRFAAKNQFPLGLNKLCIILLGKNIKSINFYTINHISL